jgi:Flp pilus assembly protein TadG
MPSRLGNVGQLTALRKVACKVGAGDLGVLEYCRRRGPMYRLVRVTSRRRARGQALAEFALVFPIMFLVIAGIIQYGLIFWAQNTLTQIARDTGRWAATQQSCDPGVETPLIISTANSIAASSSLLGYSPSPGWNGSNVAVSWVTESGSCPPTGNLEVSYIRITLNHNVPVFFPWLPGVSGNLTTQTQFRMEPKSG